jgi:tryptophan synthase alpha chain
LEKGITIKKSLEAVKELRNRSVDIPLVLMGYYNPMLTYGLEKFVGDAIDAGADGFIIPDLPMEESEEFTSAQRSPGVRAGSGATRQGSTVEAQLDGGSRTSTTSETNTRSPLSAIPLIQMLAPTTPNERMEMIAGNAKGFIYLVSVTGVTGERKSISEGLGNLITRVRAYTSVPVCVGFGISTPEQAKQVGLLADGVIVGSACVKAIGGSENPLERAREFAKDFARALRSIRQ